jgi:hypothetical protein
MFPLTLTNALWSARIEGVLPESGPVAQLGARFHGMEEVIGSIPIRSTNYFNNLGAISGNNRPVPREHLGMESFLEGRFGSSSA